MGPQNSLHLNHKSLSLRHTNFVIPFVATISLFAGAAAFLNPLSFVDNSYADSSSVDISATVASTLGISTNVNKVDLDITTDDYENLVTGDVTVNVSTSNAYGYTLSVSAEGNETALVNKDNNNLKIPTLSNETTSTTWASDNNLNNTWGFTHNNTDLLTTGTYLPMVASNEDGDTTVKVTSEPKNSSETKVTFATKIDKTQLSGDYSNKIIFSAIANSEPKTLKYLATKAGATTMQGFSSDICSEADVWQEGEEDLILTDSRDDNEYQIRKLADNHCWMVQNLRIASKNLANSDSDTSSSFTLPSSSKSWCTNDNAGCDNTAKVYLYSYNITYGAYYNWYTATAGSGTYETNTSGTNVNYSICPKGWKLPKGDTSDYSWYYLAQQYGFTGSNYSDSAFFSNFQIATRTGSGYWAGSYNGSHGDTNSFGYWWSRTADNNNLAYILSADGGYVNPRGHYNKYLGLSVRCVFVGS